MRVALARRHHATGEVGLGEIHLAGHRTVEEGQVDGVTVAGPLTSVQAAEHGNRRVQSGEHIRHRDADLARGPFDGACNAHQAAERLDGEIIAGQVAERACAAEAGNGADDEAGIDGEQLFRAQAETIGAGGTEVFQEDVAARARGRRRCPGPSAQARSSVMARLLRLQER